MKEQHLLRLATRVTNQFPRNNHLIGGDDIIGCHDFRCGRLLGGCHFVASSLDDASTFGPSRRNGEFGFVARSVEDDLQLGTPVGDDGIDPGALAEPGLLEDPGHLADREPLGKRDRRHEAVALHEARDHLRRRRGEG